MPDDLFDAIIVGAGVAGSTAAYLLAKAGLDVVLIERGPYPGSKNLSGGVLYGRALHQILPNFWEEAPIERIITNQAITFMTSDATFTVDFKSQSFDQPPYNAVTVLRAKFDRWLAGKAEEAGANLVTGIKVDQVLKEDNRIVGVVAGDEEIRAHVVIAADGANSFIAQEAGLRDRVPSNSVAVGVKELIGLPRETIAERFHLTGTQGKAYSVVGFATRGVAGGGFLYTNLDSLSIGLVIRLDDLLESKLNPADIFEDFLHHPAIEPLTRDGKLLEYGAHLVPEGGLAMMPRLYMDGMLLVGDAAGLGVNNGFVVRGMDLAIGSAIAAADCIVEASAAGDFSAQHLSSYQEKLDHSFVMADMRTYARAPDFFKKERLYRSYPDMLASLMTHIYTQDPVPKRHALDLARQSAKDCQVSVFDLLRDMLDGARAL